jgi:hypothetical protein
MTPAEAMQSHLAELSEDLARSVEAQVEQAKATEVIAGEVTSIREGQSELQQKFGELSDKVEEMMTLFGNYAKETAGLRSEVRDKLKAVPSGQR